jgi:hypothetical protein
MPLRRSGLILSALVIGTMAPDFEYFVRLAPGGGWGHTIPGAFGLSLPFGLAVLWLFHNFAKAPAVALLPDGMQRRLGPALEPFRFLGLRRLLLIVLSLLTGIATHLVWDAFTHSHSWVYHHVAILHRQVPIPWFHPMPLSTSLQFFSSLAGVFIVCLWVYGWYRNTPPDPKPLRIFWTTAHRTLVLAVMFAVSLGGGVLRGVLHAGIPRNRHLITEFAGRAVVTAGALLWWQLVAWGLLMRTRVIESAQESELTPR